MYSKSMLMVAGLTLMASPAAAAQQDSGKSRAKAAERTYCLQFSMDTGSRINRTECKTKKEWAMLGVDVDELGVK